MKRAIWGLLVLGAVLWATPGVGADNFYMVVKSNRFGTAIGSLPFTITQSGFYYLTGNLTYHGTGNAITINADEVTLDLMGCCLSGLGAGKGIYLQGKNVEVRNGSVKHFHTGLYGPLSFTNRLANLKVRGCGTGIEDHAQAIIITGCQVSENAGTGILSEAKCGVIDLNTAGSNGNVGFALPNFSGVVTNNVACANSIGFQLSNLSETLVTQNASFQNSQENWDGLNGCTKGLNTP